MSTRLGLAIATFVLGAASGDLLAPAALATPGACVDAAYSYGEVVSAQPRGRLIEVRPQTLCAETREPRRRELESIGVHIDGGQRRRLGPEAAPLPSPVSPAWPFVAR